MIFVSILLILCGFSKKNKTFFIISNYFGSLILFILLLLGFFFLAPTQVKNYALKILGISISNYKQSSFALFYRYSTIFYDREIGYFQNLVWAEKSDPKNPDSGWWGSRIHTLAFPLLGENVEIVPENSIGYNMDSTCNVSTWGNNAYSYSDISSLFKSDSINAKYDTYYSSVYCFVSKDFNGTWARISTEGGASGKFKHEYDLSKKGTWQKLQIYFKTNSGIPPVYLFWAKNGATDFYHLKGHIIFAYPEYRKIKVDPKDPDTGWGLSVSTRISPLFGDSVEIVPKNSIGYKMDSTCDASTWSKNAYSYTDISSLFQGDSIAANNEYYYASVFCFVSKDFDGTWARISTEGGVSGKSIQEYDLTKKGTWQKLQIYFTANSGIPPIYLFWSKDGVTDFKSLKGHIIYAYPEYYKKTAKAHL
jgi:hypothetical protein